MTTTIKFIAEHVMEGKLLAVTDPTWPDGVSPMLFGTGGNDNVCVHDANSLVFTEIDESEGDGMVINRGQEINLDFGAVVDGLKKGKRYARSGWNGKGMFIFLVNGSNFKVNREPLLTIMGEGTEVTYRPHVDMKTVDGEIVPWICSQSDMLANDWCLVT